MLRPMRTNLSYCFLTPPPTPPRIQGGETATLLRCRLVPNEVRLLSPSPEIRGNRRLHEGGEEVSLTWYAWGGRFFPHSPCEQIDQLLSALCQRVVDEIALSLRADQARAAQSLQLLADRARGHMQPPR